MKRVRVRFSGRVQGVGFRATARAVAARHPVTGWVRNEPDGTVLMEVQGAPGDVDSVLEALRRRMEGFIRSVSVDPSSCVEGETGFTIAR